MDLEMEQHNVGTQDPEQAEEHQPSNRKPQLKVEIPGDFSNSIKPNLHDYSSPKSTLESMTLDSLKKMSRCKYLHLYEQQDSKSKVYRLFRNPVPAIVIAYIIMSLIVVTPLGEKSEKLSINDLTYLLIYIPFVALFCFAVFFGLTYTFFNLPRVPERAMRTLFQFLIVWISVQTGAHIFLKGIAFTLPFSWIFVSFGLGVPLIYVIVYFSIPKSIRNGKPLKSDSEYSKESKQEIPMRVMNEPNSNDISSSNVSTPTSVATPMSGLIPQSLSQSENLAIRLPMPTTPTSEISDISTTSNTSSITFPNISTTDLSSINNNSSESMDAYNTINLNPEQEGQNGSSIEIQKPAEPAPKKRSFLFKYYIVGSTLSLGPLGYVFFHLFLLAFYSVTSNIAQSFLIVSFQMLVLLYKLIFRLSFHRMRSNVPEIPLRVFQDGRVLFLFWLELSSHCFFSMVFPHVSSWYMIVLYIFIEAITLSGQILVDTERVRSFFVRTFEGIYEFILVRKYKGEIMYRVLGLSGELDRTVSLELFFFNCMARALAGIAYCIFTLVIYYGPNRKNYETINSLSESNYYLTLIYAISSVISCFVQMGIFKLIMKRVYKLNLIKQGTRVWKRKPDVAFFFTTNCFILPLVALLDHNNAVSYLLSFNGLK